MRLHDPARSCVEAFINSVWSGIYSSTVTHTLNTMPLSPQAPFTTA